MSEGLDLPVENLYLNPSF
jgi:hypothetical protein